jgi:hypothetical protein
LISAQKGGHTLLGSAGIIFAQQSKEAIAEQPRFDVNIIYKNDHRTKDAYYTEVFDKSVFVP